MFLRNYYSGNRGFGRGLCVHEQAFKGLGSWEVLLLTEEQIAALEKAKSKRED